MTAQKYTTAEIEALVAKAQQGDDASFGCLFEIWFDRVYRYTAYRVNQADCEDLVSDIFLKVVQNLSKYKCRAGVGFGAWLFKLAHNAIVDYYRKKKELLGSELDHGEQDFFSTLVDTELKPDDQTNRLYDYSRIYKFLAKLKPDHREILELKFLEDFSNKEIAAITSKSEGNVRILQLRALKEMRQYLQKDQD